MNIKDFFQQNKWFIAGLGILSLVVLVNLFPKGYVVYGEDFGQMINIGENFYNNFYNSQGNASLFYYFFYLLSKFGVSESGQLSWHLGIFIFGSYISFHIFSRLIFEKVEKFIFALISLFYALNLYTLAIFYYPWGYSSFYWLYIFIPVLAGLWLKFLKTEKLIFGAWFIAALFVASPGFGNPAFALGLAIFLFLLTILSWVFGYFVFNKELLKKIILIGFFSFFTNAYWIFPIVSMARGGISSLYLGNTIDLSWWIQHTSNPIMNTLRLLHYNPDRYFPYNFAYKNIGWLKDFFILLTFVLPFILFFSLWQKKGNTDNKKMHGIFYGMLLAFVLLVARVRFPFEKINDFIFHFPGLNTLRGYDKLATFTPFIIAVILLVFLLESRAKKYFRISVLLIVFVLLSPLPFYFGKIEQGNTRFKSPADFLVKIPEEYYKIRNIINKDLAETKVAALPFSTNSVGWANFPKWKFFGTDVTQFLYAKPFINPNVMYVNSWFFSKEFNDADYDPAWIIKLYSILNAKYLIYHKDAAEKYLDKSIEKVRYLQNAGLIKLLEENDYFSLYEIRADFIFPRVGWLKENIQPENSSPSVNAKFDDLKNDLVFAEYKKLNPKKFIVQVEKNDSGKYVFLNEPRNNNWKAYFEKNGEKTKLEQVGVLGYANGWAVKDNMKDGKIVIEYLPMKLFYAGAIVSGIALLAVLAYLVYYYAYARKDKKTA